jgi:hypothetical protein
MFLEQYALPAKTPHIMSSQFSPAVLDLPYMRCLLKAVPVGTYHEGWGAENAHCELVCAVARSHGVALQGGYEEFMKAYTLVHENLAIHLLPRHVEWAQMQALDCIHSACSSRLMAAQKLSFCVVCAINGKGFHSKMRMCSLSMALECTACSPGWLCCIDPHLEGAYD